MFLKLLEYIALNFAKETDIQKEIRESLEKGNFPKPIAKEVGKFLYLIVKVAKVTNVLELGTLVGYSTTWLASGLPENGKVITIDLNKEFLDRARKNLQKAALISKVDFLCGSAKEILENFILEGFSFDLFFIDADKYNYHLYLDLCLKLARPGSILLADNLFLKGKIFTKKNTPSVKSIALFNETFAHHKRLDSIILPLGDGLGFGVVKN